MEMIHLGKVVQQRRNELKLSQKAVCEGLCVTMALSRFENGQQTPSRDCVIAILQRLGLPDGEYRAHLTKRETRLVLLRKEIVACCTRFEQTLGEERQQARMSTLEKLHKLERSIKKDDSINQQFILRIRVTIEDHPPEKQLEMLMQAIRLTSPQFDLDALDSCLYSTDEVGLINQIAIRYARCGQRRKAIDIYERLLESLQKRNPNHSYLSLLVYNYSRYLVLEKRLEEALEILALGRQACTKQENYSMFPGLLHIEAECHYLMGDIGQSIGLYQSAYHIYGAILDMRSQKILKADIQKLSDLLH